MSAADTGNGPTVVEHIDCVMQAASNTFSSTCGVELAEAELDAAVVEGQVVFAVISLVGDLEWSVFLAMPAQTACNAVEKFFGMPIEFESADMSDAVGELTNIFVGQVKALLDQQGVTVEISLPSVLRAEKLQVLAHSGGSQINQGYDSDVGPLMVGVIIGAPA